MARIFVSLLGSIGASDNVPAAPPLRRCGALARQWHHPPRPQAAERSTGRKTARQDCRLWVCGCADSAVACSLLARPHCAARYGKRASPPPTAAPSSLLCPLYPAACTVAWFIISNSVSSNARKLARGRTRRFGKLARDDMLSTVCGSSVYAAPELVRHKRSYAGKPADIWACGIILYNMLLGKMPFKKLSLSLKYVCFSLLNAQRTWRPRLYPPL